jgi:iron(III) transport system permease protein
MTDRIRRWLSQLRLAQAVLLFSCLIVSVTVIVLPLIALFIKALQNPGGEFVGMANYRQYFQSPNLSVSLRNTIDISVWSTLISMSIGFMYAYALTRTRIRAKAFFRYAALIPIFIPTIVHGLALVYLFGRQGILTQAGIADFELYGHTGIIIAEVVYSFPQAFLMFHVALEFTDGRLYEVADSMGVSNLRKVWFITLSDIRYTVINVFFVCFTLAFTDFGAPKVLGGSYNVLATDIYKQVAGQFRLNMGAVVGSLLLIPAVVSFLIDRLISSRNTGTINAKTTSLTIKPSLKRDTFFFVFCSLVSLFFIAMVATLFVGSLTGYYPYDMRLTLSNFSFNQSTGGIYSYLHSLEMAFLTALLGTSFVFVYAYMVEKTSNLKALTQFGKLLGVLPLAIPGMVIGLSFIFFFNARANPLNFIYGTMAILVLSNILHFFSVPFLTASATLKKLDREYESVSDSMSVPRWKTFLKVSIPLSLPAVFEISMYFFVNTMTTVSAVVFLYYPKFKVASIAISHMEEAGDYGQAAAMSLLILAINILVRACYEVAVRVISHRVNRREVLE